MSKYTEKLQVYLPRALLAEFDRAVARDGRSTSEIVRSMVVDFVRENRVVARDVARDVAHNVKR